MELKNQKTKIKNKKQKNQNGIMFVSLAIATPWPQWETPHGKANDQATEATTSCFNKDGKLLNSPIK